MACGVLLVALLFGDGRQASAQNAGDSFQAYTLRHAQASDLEPQVTRLLAGLPTPAEVIADPRNNRLLVRGPAQAHDMVQQLLRSLDKPAEGAAEEGVLKAYPFGGDIAAKTRELQAAFGARPGVRIAFDARTSQILVLAPAELQSQVARQLGGEGMAPQQPIPAPQPTPALQPTPANAATQTVPGQAARAVALPTAQPRGRTVTLKNSTWEQVERSLGELVHGRLRSAGPTSPDTMTYVLAVGEQNEVRFAVQRSKGTVEVQGNPALVESCARLLQVLDAPQALKNRNQQVMPITANEPSVRRAVKLLQAAEEVRAVDPNAPPLPMAQNSIVRAMPPALANGPRPAAGTPAVPLVAQLFQQGQAPVAQGAQPAPNQPLAVPAPGGLPGGLPAGLTAGLVGSVQIEFIEGLDVLVIYGNERDVERVAAIIEEIERLSVPPVIEVYELQHANSEAVAALITQFYATVLQPRLGTVNITALQKPNALLLIGRDESVKFVKELIQRLDVPVEPSTQFAVIPLKHASASTAQTTITAFFANRVGLGPKVVVTAEFRTNSLIVQAAPRDLAEVAELVQRIDVEQAAATDELRVFPLQNSLAEELAPVLQEAINAQGGGTGGGLTPLGGGPGGAAGAAAQAGGAGSSSARSTTLKLMTIDAQGQRELASSGILTDVRITPDPRANALIVTGPPNSMALIDLLIRQLDQIPAAESQIKVFAVVNGDAQLMVTMLQALFGQQQGAGGGGGGLFGGGAAGGAAQAFLSENPLVSMRFAVDLRTNSIIASGSSKDLLIVEAILLRLDASEVRQRQSIVYRLKNAPALAVATTINDFLQSQRNVQALAPEQVSPFQQIEREVVVVPEQVSNSLIVSATPRYFEDIKKIVEELDARPPMVMIQVMIGEVTLNNTDEFGVELGLQDSLLFNRSLLGDLLTTTNSTQQPSGNTVVTTTNQIIRAASNTPGFNFNNQPLGNSGSDSALATKDKVAGQALTNFSVGRVNSELGFGGLVLSASSDAVSVLIRALKECRRLEVLSRPQVMTMDNQPAFIQVGQRVPRIQGVTLGQFGQTNNVVDVNVGIILGVTPRISPDGLVVMEIDAERSRLGPEAEGVPISTSSTGEVVRQPLIDTVTAQTTVSAASGQTIVLGGLITKETAKVRRRVPLLSSIPIVGNLFRYDQDQTGRRELLIIMTPHIVRNEADADIVKQAEAARMSWCLGDVRKMHGDPGIYNRSGEWLDGQTIVINPDQMPLGVESVPTPVPTESILPPGAITVPDGTMMQGPALMPAPQTVPQMGPPAPPQPGPSAPLPPPGAQPQQIQTLPQASLQPTPVPPQQGPSLAPIPTNPDQVRYGPPPGQTPGGYAGQMSRYQQPQGGGSRQNVTTVYYQQPVAAPPQNR